MCARTAGFRCPRTVNYRLCYVTGRGVGGGWQWEVGSEKPVSLLFGVRFLAYRCKLKKPNNRTKAMFFHKITHMWSTSDIQQENES